MATSAPESQAELVPRTEYSLVFQVAEGLLLTCGHINLNSDFLNVFLLKAILISVHFKSQNLSFYREVSFTLLCGELLVLIHKFNAVVFGFLIPFEKTKMFSQKFQKITGNV